MIKNAAFMQRFLIENCFHFSQTSPLLGDLGKHELKISRLLQNSCKLHSINMDFIFCKSYEASLILLERSICLDESGHVPDMNALQNGERSANRPVQLQAAHKADWSDETFEVMHSMQHDEFEADHHKCPPALFSDRFNSFASELAENTATS